MDGPQIKKIMIDEIIIKQFDSIIMKLQLLELQKNKRFKKLHNQISFTWTFFLLNNPTTGVNIQAS